MKLKQFLLGIAFIFCCGMFFNSCTKDDEMDSGHTIGGKDPDSMIRSTQDSSLIIADDTIAVIDFAND